MIERWRRAGLLGPAVLILATVPVLLAMAFFQMQAAAGLKRDRALRLERSGAEPASYAQVLSDFVRTGDVEFRRVRVRGVFDHGQERHVLSPSPAPGAVGPGWEIYTPLKPESGLPPVYVNRGWVPEELKDPAKRGSPRLAVAEPVTITGLVRVPVAGQRPVGANDPAANRWTTRDPEVLRRGAGANGDTTFAPQARDPYAPFTLDAEPEPEGTAGAIWPKPFAQQFPSPIWATAWAVADLVLALILLGILLGYGRRRKAGEAGFSDLP